MVERSRAWVSWSGGKDCALALREATADPTLEVVGLLTTLDADRAEVAVHGVGRAVLEAQAASLGLPLHVVELPWPCPNEVYEARAGAALARARTLGVGSLVFGDLHLEDIRRYRDGLLEGSGVVPRWPLWQRPTPGVARSIIDGGFKALVACVDLDQAPEALAGRWYDDRLLADLPAGADPCGEGGEFHTVVVDGPGWAHPLDVVVGPTTRRGRFAFAGVELA